MNKPKIGQTIWLKPTRNTSRYGDSVIEAKVLKIGRIYFTVSGISSQENLTVLSLDKWMEKSYSYNYWKGYESLEEIENEKESNQLNSFIRRHFERSYYARDSLDALRKISEILKIEIEKQTNLTSK